MRRILIIPAMKNEQIHVQNTLATNIEKSNAEVVSSNLFRKANRSFVEAVVKTSWRHRILHRALLFARNGDGEIEGYS